MENLSLKVAHISWKKEKRENIIGLFWSPAGLPN